MSKDARVRFTKTILRDSLIFLLKEKSLNRITVKELCEYAEINRSTFYVYYTDVYALFEKIEEEFIEKIYNKSILFSIPKNEKREEMIFKDICIFFKENQDIFLAIIGKNGDPGFSRKLSDRILKGTNYIKKEVPMNYSNEIEQRFAVIYTIKGTMEIIYEWVKDDSVLTIDEISNLLYRLNYEGMNSKK